MNEENENTTLESQQYNSVVTKMKEQTNKVLESELLTLKHKISSMEEQYHTKTEVVFKKRTIWKIMEIFKVRGVKLNKSILFSINSVDIEVKKRFLHQILEIIVTYHGLDDHSYIVARYNYELSKHHDGGSSIIEYHEGEWEDVIDKEYEICHKIILLQEIDNAKQEYFKYEKKFISIFEPMKKSE